MNATGIDVSVYQSTTPPLAGLSFLFARASIALSADTMYAKHIAKARAAGLVTGAYHFGNDSFDPATQAAVFLKAAGDVDFYFLDVEGRRAMSYPQIRAFFAAVRKAGKQIGLYGSESGFPQLGQDFSWVANWSSTPSIPWDFHQYRGSPLDLDRFNGTDAQLRALAGGLPDSSTGGDMTTITDIERYATPRKFSIAAGATVRGFKPTSPTPAVVDTFATASGASALATVRIDQSPDATVIPHGTFLLGADGEFKGLYIPAGEVTLAPAPVTPAVDCTQAVADARVEAANAATTVATDKAKLAVGAAADVLRTAGLLA